MEHTQISGNARVPSVGTLRGWNGTLIAERCDSCGEDYHAPERELGFDLCEACRLKTPLIAIVGNDDPEETRYAAGVAEAARRILEEFYWNYVEFSNEEWEAVEAIEREIVGCDCCGVGFALQAVESCALEPDFNGFNERVQEYAANLQKLWNAGVERGILKTNVQHQPGGPVFRQWPIEFSLKVRVVTLAELIENGVVVAR